MTQTQTLNSISALPLGVPLAGWSATNLRIGRVYVGSVHIHDTQGAYTFREFLDVALVATSRKRRSKNATRYLEHLPPSIPTRILSEEAADYLQDMARRKLSKSTISSMKHYFRLLMVATGDIPVSRITCDHIREFWEVLRWWPAYAGSLDSLKGMSDQELYAAGKASNKQAPAQATLLLAQRQVTAFFNRLLKKRVISSSPMDGFGEIKRSLVEATTRRGFTDEELGAIFGEKTFLPWAKKTPHNWWAPMIGLYTGARVGEVAQLKVAEIVQDNGIWCFKIRVSHDEDGGISQSLKGGSSIRVIPIARALLDAGFLDFYEDAKASGHPRLFPQLKLGSNKETGECNGTSYGSALCRQFAGHLKRHHNIGKGLAFHCFRHCLTMGLAVNGTPLALIASITGHSESGEKKFPVLEQHYLHLPTEGLRNEQVAALAAYKPPVILPRYTRGQFAHCFGRHAKKHP